jgi:hypothetical protein
MSVICLQLHATWLFKVEMRLAALLLQLGTRGAIVTAGDVARIVVTHHQKKSMILSE